MRRPVAYLAVAIVILAIMAVPLAKLHLGQPSAETLPAGAAPRVALEQVAAEYSPGLTGPIEIVVPTPGGPYDRTAQARLATLDRLLAGDSGVQMVIGPPLTADPPATSIQQRQRRRWIDQSQR